MENNALRLSSCLFAIVLGAAGCGGEEVGPGAVQVKRAPLTSGSCVVPSDVLTASASLGRKTIAAGTSSATAGDSLLAANNIVLGTFPAGTTVIVGFQGLNQLPSSFTGDTFLRLSDENGEVAVGDDACGGLGSRIVYTVPQGNRTLTVRVGCWSGGSCAGDLVKWSRLDSNGQLSDVVRAHAAIIMGSDATGAASPNGGSFGGTSVRNLTDLADNATHFGNTSDLVAPIQGGHQGYIKNGSNGIYSHFEGVQRLRTLPNFVAVTGAFRADLMFGVIGTASAPVSAGQSWLTAGALADGNLRFRYSNYDVPAPAAEHTNVTEFNHLAGIQTAGRYLACGVSNYPHLNAFDVPQDNPWGRLLLLDASSPANVGTTSTMRKWIMDPEVMAGNTDGIGPSQVGITRLQNGAYLLAMSQNAQTKFHFFLKDIDDDSTVLQPSGVRAGFADLEDGTFATPSSPNARGWTVQNGTGGAVGPDNDGIALVTQTDGSVFLLVTKYASPFSRSQVAQVILTPKAASSDPARRAERFTASIGPVLGTNAGYQCAGASVGCNFTGAAGFYINSFDDNLELYSTSQFLKDNSPSATPPTSPPTLSVSEFSSNLAFGRPVFASSENPASPASNATNGSLQDAARTNVESNAWNMLDLGPVRAVTGIKIVPCVAAQGCTAPANFNVFTWTGSSWALQFSHAAAMQAGVPESITFGAGPIQTAFILVQLNGAGSLQLAEYQVF